MHGSRDDAPPLRRVMGAYPTGVTIVAARGEGGEPFGLTVNSFTSVSLDPPLVLFCISHTSTSHDRLLAVEAFGVSLLSGDQDAIARRFAEEPSDGRFDGVAWTSAASGAPLLEGALAWLECRRQNVFDGGDHSIVLGHVVEASGSDRPALLFYRGRLTSTAP
jgi:flavin reductase (DIM6/NTAB) family NADH-FMN oxidoreductase RutF